MKKLLKAVGFQTGLAWILATCVYQIGSRIENGSIKLIDLIIALLIILIVLFIVIKQMNKKQCDGCPYCKNCGK